MATYNGHFRTNYFRVQDADAFRKLMAAAGFVENGAENSFWSMQDRQNRTCYAFGNANLGISDAIEPYAQPILESSERQENNPPDKTEVFNIFCEELQKHVETDDAVVIIESGNEKLRYVGAEATLITTNTICPITFQAYLTHLLKAIMGKQYNPRFEL